MIRRNVDCAHTGLALVVCILFSSKFTRLKTCAFADLDGGYVLKV